MPRWLLGVVVIGVVIASGPGSAAAQSPIVLSNLQVQLWPEYDQPSMLVILDFEVAPGTELPAGVPIRIPGEANLMAVAVQAPDGSLLNADYLESTNADAWQSVTVQVQTPTTYRIEYYQPLRRAGPTREFTFEWTGDLAVQNLGVSLRLPADAGTISTDPALQTTTSDDLAGYREGVFGALTAGQDFSLGLTYSRDSETLTAPQQELLPTQPLDTGTPGRVSTSNYLPYFLLAVGIVLIGGGAFYFWQAGRTRAPQRARHSGEKTREGRGRDEVYCHECGTRAQAGDKFCRVCGARLRPPE